MRQLLLFFILDIPFIDGDHHGAAFALGQIGDAQVLLFKRNSCVQQNHDHFGKFHRPQPIADRQFFDLILNLCLFAHASRVEHPHWDALPVNLQRYGIAGDPCLWTG